MSAGTALAQPSGPDPILAGPSEPACQTPDYVGGVDTEGHPVVPADTGAVSIVPQDIYVERPARHRGQPDVTVHVSGGTVISGDNTTCPAPTRPSR